MNESFIDKCITGDVFLDEIDDYVDTWHDDENLGDVELYEYLGMTWDEYSLWLTTPSILAYIVDARKKGQYLENASTEDIEALAARASSQEEAQRVMNWLKQIR